MRGNLGLFVSPADRARLAAIIADRNSPQKHVWRAQVAQLANFTFQGFQSGALVGRHAVPQTLIALRLADPQPQGLRFAADLRSDRADRHPLRSMLAAMLQHHPHGP
jgi:hypothetical protein